MDLTQQSILSFLVEEGGKVKKSELVRRFKGSIDSCGDPEERASNRELFKNCVNNVAVVQEIDGVRFVVVRKKYEPLVESFQAQSGKRNEDVDGMRKGELQRPPAQSQDNNENEFHEESGENPTEMINPIELALQRCKYDFQLKRGMNFEVQNQDPKQSNTKSKPYALPLRMPPPTKVEIHRLKSHDAPESPKAEASRNKQRAPSVDTSPIIGSPHLGRSKPTKAPTELKENRIPSMVPLDQSEHEWLVKCAAGHWSHVYGLLMRDSHLAEKRDFISGFTALHWAAKCGKSEMLVKIIDLSKQGGVELEINAKTHGGYTPLHIAALHDQEYIMAMLVGEYGADPTIRDNCGRRPYHYLHKGVSPSIREMLGEPKITKKVQEVKVGQCEKDETDLSRSRQSFSKLFQPNLTGQRKKQKQRPGLYSFHNEREEERDEASFRLSLLSDVFM